MPNPVIHVLDAGRGETPVPADALLQPGQTLACMQADGSNLDAMILAVVPPGVSPEHAVADQTGSPRPLMITRNAKRTNQYVIRMGPEGARTLTISQSQLAQAMKAGLAASKKD